MDLEKIMNKPDTQVKIRNMKAKDSFSGDTLRKFHPIFPNTSNYLKILTDNCRKPVEGLQYEILGGSHKFQ